MDNKNDERIEYLENETIDLVLDDGTSMTCDVIGIFEIEDKEYIALGEPDGENILFYVYEQNGEEMQLLNIETEEEYQEVVDTFMELFGEFFEEEE